MGGDNSFQAGYQNNNMCKHHLLFQGANKKTQ